VEGTAVKGPFVSKTLSPPVRRRIELAIAVAQERLLATHVEHALELIQQIADQIPFDEGLAIYNRLLRLSDDEARIITTRALAALGGRSDQANDWPERMAEADAAARAAAAERGARSILDHIRQRLRGRVHDDLRLWIELEAARTEVALIETQVENALSFAEMLKGELSCTEAVQLYLEALDVRENIGEVVYYMTLARLRDSLLPVRSPAIPAPDGEAEVIVATAEDRRLRVIEGDAG